MAKNIIYFVSFDHLLCFIWSEIITLLESGAGERFLWLLRGDKGGAWFFFFCFFASETGTTLVVFCLFIIMVRGIWGCADNGIGATRSDSPQHLKREQSSRLILYKLSQMAKIQSLLKAYFSSEIIKSNQLFTFIKKRKNDYDQGWVKDMCYNEEWKSKVFFIGVEWRQY